MNNFNEKDHPRDRDGKFTNANGGSGSDDVKEQIAWARKNGKELPLNADGSLDTFKLGKMYSEWDKSLDRVGNSNQADEKKSGIHIDFDSDNLLPELNKETIEALGAKESKKVLLKKHVIDRNFEEHDDLTKDDFEQIISQALYDSPEVFPANSNKPSYYHLANIVEKTSKGKPEIGLVLLDIDAQKDNFEIVHAHYVNKSGLSRAKKRATKKD